MRQVEVTFQLNRYTSTDDIEALSGTITDHWASIDGKHDPERSLEILSKELDKKKVGSGR